MDTISGSCEMKDSQGSSFVTDFYHFTNFTVVFSPKSLKKIEKIIKLLGQSGRETQHFIFFGLRCV